MLIEGGYAHSLKALLEKSPAKDNVRAAPRRSMSSRVRRPPSHLDHSTMDALVASLSRVSVLRWIAQRWGSVFVTTRASGKQR